MINYEQALNPEQLAVVETGDGPCLVLAGAGSGKTRAITYRVAYLLEKGVAPENVLLVTFTNKAAREMISRVQLLTQGEIRLPWSGTFHHIGYRILRQYAPLLGYKNNFTVLDSEDSVDLFKLCLKQEGIDRATRRFPSPKVLQAIISYARNAETTIEDVLDLQHPQWLGIAEQIRRVGLEYQKRKKEANAVDFDDLLVNTHLLLSKSEKVRKKFSQQFQYVLVDEYQDTSKIQASIIKFFASHHKNILVVGDDAQSIYSFRAAEIKNILDFGEEYPGAKVFRLETNYRSTPEILAVANEVIANNENQHRKNLKSVLGACVRPEAHAFADAPEEAEFIANRILDFKLEGVPLSEVAVLFRAAHHSQALEVELAKRDLPYDYRGGVRFFERAHVKDVLAYLRLVNNIEDAVAWSRVLNMQMGIGPAGVAQITSSLHHFITSSPPIDLRPLGSLLSPRGQVGWNDFLQVWSRLEGVDEKTPSELIRAVIESKYQEYLEAEYPDYRERLQDLEQLAVISLRETDLNQFLATASLQESYSARQAQAGEVADNKERMVLSTIHQAKGLEWEAVFVLNMSAGQFPSERAVREANGLEEERRLFYVAITRAKKHLYFSYPLMASFGGLQGPSMLLDEIDQRLFDHHAAEGGTVFASSDDKIDGITYEAIDRPVRSFLKDLDEL